MDQYQYIFLDIASLKRLIREKDSKDKYRTDELVVAIFLAGFCQKMWGVECGVGFPLKHSETDFLPAIKASNLEEIKQILNAKTEQDHDTDVVIVNHTPHNSERSGKGFQIKRFDTHQKDLSTTGILDFIKKKSNFAKTDSALVILLETGQPTQFTQIHSLIDTKKFPFSNLYFVGLYENTLKFIEAWPNLGKEEISWFSV